MAQGKRRSEIKAEERANCLKRIRKGWGPRAEALFAALMLLRWIALPFLCLVEVARWV